MNADVAATIAELREAWPYQGLPAKHVRHWRDLLGIYPPEVVAKVLMDAKTTMAGRPTWGEFGALCGQYSMALARQKRRGPFLDESVPVALGVPEEVRAALSAGVEEFAQARRARLDAAREEANR